MCCEGKMSLKFSQLKTSELKIVNKLISRSKAHWYSDEAYLEKSMALINITSDWMKTNEGWCIYDAEELVGFLGYSKYDDYWYLEHLWIDAKKIGHEYGRDAMTFFLDRAKNSSIHKISLLPEPHAEDFYLKFGAEFTEVEVPSLHRGGPTFREMIIRC